MIEPLEAEGGTGSEVLEAIPDLAIAGSDAWAVLDCDVLGLTTPAIRVQWLAAALVPCRPCPGRSC